jgi:hypothetical protein
MKYRIQIQQVFGVTDGADPYTAEWLDADLKPRSEADALVQLEQQVAKWKTGAPHRLVKIANDGTVTVLKVTSRGEAFFSEAQQAAIAASKAPALQVQVVGEGEQPKAGAWVTVGYLVPSKAPIWECAAVRRRQQTADAAGFLWRNGHGMWNASSPAHLQGYLRGSSVGRIIDDAEDLQLTIATATADKIQSVLVGYVARPCRPHAPRCPCKVCTP